MFGERRTGAEADLTPNSLSASERGRSTSVMVRGLMGNASAPTGSPVSALAYGAKLLPAVRLGEGGRDSASQRGRLARTIEEAEEGAGLASMAGGSAAQPPMPYRVNTIATRFSVA